MPPIEKAAGLCYTATNRPHPAAGRHTMKKVDFVQIKAELCGYGLGQGTRYCFDGVEELIRQRLESGWEYNGYVPLTTRGTGTIETISLIFRKELED